jgi:biotin operon repressor
LQKIYIVRLSDDERDTCLGIIKKLKGSSTKVQRANLLLKADADGPHWKDQDIADTFFCSRQTVENLRKRLVTEGFEVALHRKQRAQPPRQKILDGEKEAQVIALRMSDPPAGRNGWTLSLLAKKIVELEIAPAISHVTVLTTIKKNKITSRKVQYYVIPPKSNGEFVARMEAVLDIYALPYDPKIPVITMDE